MGKAIEVKGLKKNYRKVQALRGLDFEVEAGQIYGLLGPNGAGKSTLLKALVGAVKPSSGAIEVLGRAVPRQAREVRSKLGYMPQMPALYGDLSVRANVIFFARAHRLDRLEQRVDEALEFVGLGQLADRRVGTLSGGLKQRCSLACTLVHDPDLLLLDEPTAGVDPILKEGFWRHFRELASKGTTILISTHLMDEPLACDRLGILREGRLVVDDTPANILSQGRTRIIIEQGDKTMEETVTGYPRALPSILKRYGLNPDIASIRLEHESLEDVFLKLVQEEENHG